MADLSVAEAAEDLVALTTGRQSVVTTGGDLLKLYLLYSGFRKGTTTLTTLLKDPDALADDLMDVSRESALLANVIKDQTTRQRALADLAIIASAVQ